MKTNPNISIKRQNTYIVLILISQILVLLILSDMANYLDDFGYYSYVKHRIVQFLKHFAL